MSEAATMTGGFPAEIKTVTPESQGGTKAVEQAETVKEETAHEKVIVGGKEFGTPEEAIAFFSKKPEAPAPVQYVQAPVPQEKKDIDPSDILFEDPKTALRLVEERAYSRATQDITAAQRAETNRMKMWESFYEKNPDLKSVKSVVDGEFSKRIDAMRDLPVEHALDILAASARKTIGEVKKATLQGKPLSSQPVKVSSASGAPAQPVQASKVVPKSFVEELREAKRRKA